MKSFILQQDFEKSVKKVKKKNYSDLQKDLKKLDNGIEILLTEEQKRKYKLGSTNISYKTHAKE